MRIELDLKLTDIFDSLYESDFERTSEEIIIFKKKLDQLNNQIKKDDR
jgi:hypothetical protein